MFVSGLFVHSENREIHAAVGAVLREVGQRREVVSLAVLHYHYAVGVEHLRVENGFRHAGEVGEVVGRVGKDAFSPS